MRNRIAATALFAGWLLVGAAMTTVAMRFLMIASIGGVFTPPATWIFARNFGMYALPPMLMLGGIPTAIQIWRGRSWQKLFAVSATVCCFAWLATIIVVWEGPELFGWSW